MFGTPVLLPRQKLHVLDHLAVRRRSSDSKPPTLLQPAEQLVEVRSRPIEPVDAGGLEEEHLDVVLLRAANGRDGELAFHRRSHYGHVVRFLYRFR